MVFYLFATGQPLFNNGIINLDKAMAGMENMAPKNEFNSGNSDKKINLAKNKLFIYLLAN